MRHRLIEQLRQQIDRYGFPRLEMTAIVAVTALAGLIASWSMLRFAVLHVMALRYPLAVAVAYGVFIGLLWLWLRARSDVCSEYGPSGSADEGGNGWDGGGGGSGGGGASASWQGTASPRPSSGQSARAVEMDLGLGDIDEPAGWLMIAALALIAIAVFSGIYLVWIAPGLLAEIALDAALAGGLYRRLRRIERQHWMHTVLRRTIAPFLVTAIVLGGLGFAAQRAYPWIDSLNDVMDARGQATTRSQAG